MGVKATTLEYAMKYHTHFSTTLTTSMFQILNRPKSKPSTNLPSKNLRIFRPSMSRTSIVLLQRSWTSLVTKSYWYLSESYGVTCRHFLKSCISKWRIYDFMNFHLENESVGILFQESKMSLWGYCFKICSINNKKKKLRHPDHATDSDMDFYYMKFLKIPPLEFCVHEPKTLSQ